MTYHLPPSLPAGLRGSFLRDTLRGATRVAWLAQDALRPVSRLLPNPLAKAVEDGLIALEALTCEDDAVPLDAASLERARAFVVGRSDRAEDAEACARCLGFAWERLSRKHHGLHHVLFSEAVTAGLIFNLVERGDNPDKARAADILEAVMGSGAILVLPGSPTVTETEIKRASEDVISSALVWLLASRGSSASQELALLDMAQALIRATTDATASGTRSGDIRNAWLRNLAAHL